AVRAAVGLCRRRRCAKLLRRLARAIVRSGPRALRKIRRHDRAQLGRRRRLQPTDPRHPAWLRRGSQQQNPRPPTPRLRPARRRISQTQNPHVRPARIVKPTRNLPTKKREDPENNVPNATTLWSPFSGGATSPFFGSVPSPFVYLTMG